jgi:hypothetical protein
MMPIMREGQRSTRGSAQRGAAEKEKETRGKEKHTLDGGVGDLLSRHFAGCREKRTRSTGLIVN